MPVMRAPVSRPSSGTRCCGAKNRSLWSRLHCRITIHATELGDTNEYVGCRLRRVGAKEMLFNSDPLTLLHDVTTRPAPRPRSDRHLRAPRRREGEAANRRSRGARAHPFRRSKPVHRPVSEPAHALAVVETDLERGRRALDRADADDRAPVVADDIRALLGARTSSSAATTTSSTRTSTTARNTAMMRIANAVTPPTRRQLADRHRRA
jgi:hypothetical protein